ncbi:MAG: branched-chain amino acid ABC transporter permease, partial [Bradyrhizobium icense]
MSMFRLDQILMAAAIAAMIVFAMVSTSEESLNLISLILIWGLFAIGFDLIFV